MADTDKDVSSRTEVYRSAIGRVVDIAAASGEPPSGCPASFQIGLTYKGLFGYQVGARTAYIDANRTLFVTKGQDFRDRHPVTGRGHASVVIVPDEALLRRVLRSSRPERHAAFRMMSAPSSGRLRLLTHFVRDMGARDRDLLRNDELIVAAVTEAVPDAMDQTAGLSPRIIDRAKQLMHARSLEPISLADFAREVGSSPTHLTRQFSRSEGRPLYRYQLNLRLSEALRRLPRCEAITELAFDLGFSSHAHFTSAFRAEFGISPSAYRREVRAPVPVRSRGYARAA